MQKLVDKFCGSSYQENQDFFLELLEPVGGRLLDLGCNDGSFTQKIAKKARASEIFAVEIETASVAKAKKRGIKVFRADLNQKLPFKTDFFDTATANQVIEHLHFTDDFLEEIKRVLKPGGQLVISTTNLAALHYRLQLFIGQMPICLHPAQVQYGNFLHGQNNPRYGHKSVFTHRAFLEFITSHGFKLGKSQSIRLYPLPGFLSKIVLSVFPNLGVFSTVRAVK